MKTIFEHIEHVKKKPHHIRKQIAFSASALGASLIAFVWLAGSLWTGAFAIKANSFAGSAAQSTVADENNSVAGAAAAFSDANAPSRIEIVDTATTSSQKRAEQTILPF